MIPVEFLLAWRGEWLPAGWFPMPQVPAKGEAPATEWTMVEAGLDGPNRLYARVWLVDVPAVER